MAIVDATTVFILICFLGILSNDDYEALLFRKILMILVIDAYNVLKSVFWKNHISESLRNQFIKQLAGYARKKGHKIVVVFDVGPYDYVTKDRIKGIAVIYSGVHESADDVIKRYLKEHSAKDLWLVS